MQRLYTALQQWISIREDTIQQIHNTIENLKFHHRNVNISRIGGSTMSIVGSAIAIGSIVMAPATAGLSLSLPVIGAALAVAGGGATVGASIADVLIQKSNVQQAQQQLTRDYEQLYVISALATAIQRRVDDEREREQCQGISTPKLHVRAELGVALTQDIFRTGIRIASIGGTVATITGVVTNMITIPFDLIEIVRSSSSLANGSETDAVKELSKIVEQLEQEKEAIARIQEEQDQVINESPQK